MIFRVKLCGDSRCGDCPRLSSVQLDKSDLLQHDVAMRVRKDFFLDAVLSTGLGGGKPKCRDAWFDRDGFEAAMPLFLREETVAIGNDQPQVPRTCHIHARKINLIQNSVA